MHKLSIAISLLTPVILLGQPRLTSEVVIAEHGGPVIVRMQITFEKDDPKQYYVTSPAFVEIGVKEPFVQPPPKAFISTGRVVEFKAS